MSAATPEAPAVTDAPWWRPVPFVVGAWASIVAAAATIEVPWPVQRGALFLHLASLVAGFGAVIVADVHGVLWLTGRRTLGDVVRVTDALHPLIRGGLAGLVASGLFLDPALDLPRTWLKLALVLAAAINGLWATHLSRRLGALDLSQPVAATEPALLAKVMVCGAVSQAAWWGATLVGFLATTS